MEDVDSKLCNICMAALKGGNSVVGNREGYRTGNEKNDIFNTILYGEWYRTGNDRDDFFNIVHHQTYSDFVASKENGCFICTWLWANHPHLPQTSQDAGQDSEDQSAIGIFQIYCHVDFAYSGPTTARVFFHAQCPWYPNIELQVYIGTPSWADTKARPCSTLDMNLRFDQALQNIQDWISVCETHHKHCYPPKPAAGTFFPTRVVDVEKVELGIVSLCNRDELVIRDGAEDEELPQRMASLDSMSPGRSYPPYWTLSHRWGDPNKIPRLVKTTEDRFYKGFSVDELSPTFRDAVHVVRRLGYRYIWIDSLCIRQDSLSDWQREASTMVDVYRHSFCNISAIAPSADPSSSGLFEKRFDGRPLFPFVANTMVKVANEPWTDWSWSTWDNEIEGSPLSRRGWVVQERFLARRVIHFTRNQVYWECLEDIRCEADPAGYRNTLDSENQAGRQARKTTVYKAARLQLARTRENRNQEGAGSVHYHQHWGALVSIYVSCNLTKESDRLVAMSGIAKVFQEIDGDTCLAGLWKRMIYMDLGWYSNARQGASVRRSNSYAPSWSWASVVGGVVNLNIPHTKFGSLPLELIKLIDVRIIPEHQGGDTMGLLRSAELDIECMLYYYCWLGQSKTLRIYTDEARTQCFIEEEDGRADLRLDTSDLVQRFTGASKIEGICVPINGSYEGYGGGYNQYLVLEKDSDSRFGRVGLLRAGGIGRLIYEWRGKRSRITLI